MVISAAAPGKTQGELAPTTNDALDGDVAAHGARELSADRQSESDPAIIPAMGAGLELHEGNEDRVELVGGNADSRVAHLGSNRRAVGTALDCHAAAAVRELDRVGDEVHQNLIDLLAVRASDEILRARRPTNPPGRRSSVTAR